jgi:predicted GNAT family acetyltransferase
MRAIHDGPHQEAPMATDKTGAQTDVNSEDGRYTIAVEGKTVGHSDTADRGNQRVFYRTEVDDDFGGRGLATILVREALEATRADGRRVVPVCEMVAGVIEKSPEFQESTDPVTADIRQWAQSLHQD